MAVGSLIQEILQRPTIGDMMTELVMFTVPIWIAVVVGVLVGWAWKPKWADSGFKVAKSSSSKASIGVSSLSILSSLKFPFPGFVSSVSNDGLSETPNCSSSFSSPIENEKHEIVNGDDLEYLCKLVEVKDGGPNWIHMMDRSTSTMSYRAWRRDLESGPPQYRSSSVFENATPEMVRDFFWDDEFRLKWDDMIVSASTLEECPTTGNMVVHWVRKFPFFCSDREYIIGRRIWESGHLYYCVTKGIPCLTVPRRKKPRRVDLYYSSWCIRAVESKMGNNQVPACEVLLFHYEDMGIPWEVAKIGVRQGMWGTVKKIELGLRRYQKERALGASLSRCAFMAQVNTKVSADYLQSLETSSSDNSISNKQTNDSLEKPVQRNVPKMLVIGGAVLLACSFDKGLLTKAVIFGVARRFGKIAGRF